MNLPKNSVTIVFRPVLFLLQFLFALKRANVFTIFCAQLLYFCKYYVFINLFTRYLGNKMSSSKPSIKSTIILNIKKQNQM